jgi:hypothetical protein
MNLPDAAARSRRVKPERVDPAFLAAVSRRIRPPDTMEIVQFFERDGVVMAFIAVPGESGPERIEVLGCLACISPSSYRREGRRVRIGEKLAPPLSSIVEDDSRNPVLDAFVLCPTCGRPIIDPMMVRQGLIGVVRRE